MDPRGFNNNGSGHEGAYNGFNYGYGHPRPSTGHPAMNSPPLRRYLGGARGEREFFPGPPPPLHHFAGPEHVAPTYFDPPAAARGNRSQGPAPEPPTFNPEARAFIPKEERDKIEAESTKKSKAEKTKVFKAKKKAEKNRRQKVLGRSFAPELFALAEKYDERKGEEEAEAGRVDAAEQDGEGTGS